MCNVEKLFSVFDIGKISSFYLILANPFDPGCSTPVFYIPPSTSATHPADPENKEDLVDRSLLAEVLELGFEESIAILAISKTKGGSCFHQNLVCVGNHCNGRDQD